MKAFVKYVHAHETARPVDTNLYSMLISFATNQYNGLCEWLAITIKL